MPCCFNIFEYFSAKKKEWKNVNFKGISCKAQLLQSISFFAYKILIIKILFAQVCLGHNNMFIYLDTFLREKMVRPMSYLQGWWATGDSGTYSYMPVMHPTVQETDLHDTCLTSVGAPLPPPTCFAWPAVAEGAVDSDSNTKAALEQGTRAHLPAKYKISCTLFFPTIFYTTAGYFILHLKLC